MFHTSNVHLFISSEFNFYQRFFPPFFEHTHTHTHEIGCSNFRMNNSVSRSQALYRLFNSFGFSAVFFSRLRKKTVALLPYASERLLRLLSTKKHEQRKAARRPPPTFRVSPTTTTTETTKRKTNRFLI